MPSTIYLHVHVVLRFLAAWLFLLGFSHSHTQAQTQTPPLGNAAGMFVMNGFTVDVSRLNMQQQSLIAPVLSAQFELIQRAELPPLLLAFMKTIPVVVDPSLPVGSTPALFSNSNASGRGVVKTSLVPIPSDKPVILHEMLHAYDWNYWRFGKPEIQSAYAQAVNQNLYPQWSGSHFLQNAREFFAVTGTVYLVGRIKQPPFDCRALAGLQPDYVKFMEKLFGQHSYCDTADPK